VLHAGKVLSEGTVAQVQADPRVQEVYLGQAATEKALAAIAADQVSEDKTGEVGA
jgi:urea transport system ATP-binding protein